MSRFNTQAKVLSKKTTNQAGGVAYEISDKEKLANLLLTSFVGNTFYKSKTDLSELAKLVPNDPLFAAKAAIFARDEYGMRSISHVLAVELASQSLSSGKPWAKAFYNKIVVRPDDMLEILALLWSKSTKHTIPAAMKRGFADALRRFDAYQIAKYRAKWKNISLVDVVNLVSPKPTNAINALVKGTLNHAETWETKLSHAGKGGREGRDERKAQAWHEMIASRKVNYLALVKNIRNIATDAPEDLDTALDMLSNEKLILKSRTLPFRYLDMLESCKDIGGGAYQKIADATNKAINASFANVPQLDGKTAVLVDTSGSMVYEGILGRLRSIQSGNGLFSVGKPMRIAAIFAAGLLKANPQNTDVVYFNERASYAGLDANDTLLSIAKQIVKEATGGGTNFVAPIKALRQPYDRLLFLSDMEGWISEQYSVPQNLAMYETNFNCKPMVYCWNLAGGGTVQFPRERITFMSGFSGKVFELIDALEQDRSALVRRIEAVQLT